MSDAFYSVLGPDRFRATELTRGPWDPGLQHAGPPAALLGRAVERLGDRGDLQVARVTFEIARPVPIAELRVATRLLRGGRSVELVEATLLASETEVMRATALRVRTADPDLPGRYDLVTIFEALHDMARPVEALRAARAMLAEGGSVVIADERVEDSFTAPAPDRDRRAYGWSVVSCLPSAMGDPETAATGAVMRPATLARYARSAGFARTEALPVETEVWRFYRLIP